MERRKILTILLVTAVLTTASLSMATGVLVLESKRAYASDYFQKRSVGQSNAGSKIGYLIVSDWLKPSTDTKIALATAYLEEGQTQKALESLEVIPGTQQKTELITFAEFEKGDYQNSLRITDNPKTEIGKLLHSLISDDFSDPGVTKIAGFLPQSSEKYQNYRLKAAAALIENGHNGLARFLLFKLNDNSPLIQTDILISQSYANEGNHEKALSWAEEAIKINPADLSLYRIALSEANSLQDKAEIADISKRIELLEKLQK